MGEYIYIGTFGHGLAIFDKEMNPIRQNKVESGFPSNSINDILVDGSYLWVATGEGLVRFNISKMDDFVVLAQPSRSVRSLIKDNEGNVWFSTGEGVGAVLAGDSVLYFDKELPIRNFNIGSCAIDNLGKLYFGSSEGLLKFLPDYVLDEKNLSMPLISGVILDGDYDNGKGIMAASGKKKWKLHHNQNNFTIVISNLDFFRQGDSFEYRLCGLDDKWHAVGEDYKVSFRELPYGEYIFEVRNAKGRGNGPPSSIEIEILPPLWLSWWAKIIYFIIAVALVAFVVVMYKKKLKQQSDALLTREKEAHQRELQEERMAFFTNITHELRTPLTLISGPLDDMVKSDSLSQDDRWKIGLIHKNAQRLMQLVNQILDFRKTETRNKRLCVCRDDIVRTIEEISMKFIELNRNRDIVIKVCPYVKKLEILFDKEVVVIILDNLISNAMKYTDRGEITVSVNKEMMDNEPYVAIYVRDTGHGISKEALPRIFDRYYQEKSDYQASGTGIGLALVKSLVELHHGNISVESEKERGTCFKIILPCDEDYPEAMHTEISSNVDKSKTDEEEMQHEDAEYEDHIVVLVVEDNPDILDYIDKSLSGIYDVKTAANGKDGLELARKCMPDVIVTDIMMPVMSGIEMCRQLKNDVATSHIPVVMLTAKDSVSDREEGYNVGADSYLAKPFNASLLVTRINNIILRRNAFAEHLQHNGFVTGTKSELAVRDEERKKLRESLSKLDREFMDKLDTIILDPENVGRVNIDMLTDQLYMSKATLYRKMKALTGMSANEYIRRVRISKAKDYILEGKMTMGEISDLLGFSSQSYFRESFKSVYGVTPTAYTKTLK